MVYNGREPWNAPLRLAPAEWMPQKLAGLQLCFTYRLFEARNYAGDDVADGNLARAKLALDAATEAGLAPALERTATLLAEVDDRELRRSFEVWCNGILRPRFGDRFPTLAKLMETPTMLADTLREWEERIVDESRREGRQAGHQAGRQAGRQEGLEQERALLRSQAERRFGAATRDELAGILADVEDSAELMRIGTLVVDCATGADLLARARRR